mgnify:CR=1 FL=1
MHKGHWLIPTPRRPRVVNFVSELENLATHGSSLLAIMFLAWSFLARILLVFCLFGLI